jgi:hypothetical protein
MQAGRWPERSFQSNKKKYMITFLKQNLLASSTFQSWFCG